MCRVLGPQCGSRPLARSASVEPAPPLSGRVPPASDHSLTHEPPSSASGTGRGFVFRRQATHPPHSLDANRALRDADSFSGMQWGQSARSSGYRML